MGMGLLILVVLVAAGCGGGEQSTSTVGKPAAPPEPGSNVPPGAKKIVAKVLTKEKKGIPAQAGQWMVDIGVDPGGDLAFTVGEVVVPEGNTNFHLVNPQKTGHDLRVELAKPDPRFEELDIEPVQTPVVRQGSAWGRMPVFAGKRYVFYCTIPGHREAGMEGIIRVDPKLDAQDLEPY
jgi:plastocyanin